MAWVCVSKRPGLYLRLISCDAGVRAADRRVCSGEVPLPALFSPGAGIGHDSPSPSAESAKIPPCANPNKPRKVLLPLSQEALCSSTPDFEVVLRSIFAFIEKMCATRSEAAEPQGWVSSSGLSSPRARVWACRGEERDVRWDHSCLRPPERPAPQHQLGN